MSLHLIGCGPGSPAYLPKAARDAARRCQRLVGREGEHALFGRLKRDRETIEVWELSLLERLSVEGVDVEVGLLVPGDAVASPITRVIRKQHVEVMGTVIPGISPLALACAKVGIDADSLTFISTVLGLDARVGSDVCQADRPGVNVVGHVTVAGLADCLFRNRCPNRRALVFRSLGTAREDQRDMDLFGLLELDEPGDAVVLFPGDDP